METIIAKYLDNYEQAEIKGREGHYPPLINNTSICLWNNILLIGSIYFFLPSIGENWLESHIMDNLILFTYTIGREEQSVSASLVMVTLLLVSAATAAGGVVHLQSHKKRRRPH